MSKIKLAWQWCVYYAQLAQYKWACYKAELAAKNADSRARRQQAAQAEWASLTPEQQALRLATAANGGRPAPQPGSPVSTGCGIGCGIMLAFILIPIILFILLCVFGVFGGAFASGFERGLNG